MRWLRDRANRSWLMYVRPGDGVALLFLLLTACNDEAPPAPLEPETAVDVDALFATPTEAEIDAVRADWSARDVEPVDVKVEGSEPFTLGSVPATLRVLSHAIPGGRHFGAVITADGAPAGSLPVVVYAHGGDDGVSTLQLALVASVLGDASAGFAWVVPSFRSETLTTGTGAWTSGGRPSPWDLDVDDALALLGAALGHAPGADGERVGVLGFSRGAGVGLLMGVRDARIDRVVEFFGPTDFFGPFVRDVVTDALLGELRDLPGLPALNEQFIQRSRRDRSRCPKPVWSSSAGRSCFSRPTFRPSRCTTAPPTRWSTWARRRASSTRWRRSAAARPATSSTSTRGPHTTHCR